MVTEHQQKTTGPRIHNLGHLNLRINLERQKIRGIGGNLWAYWYKRYILWDDRHIRLLDSLFADFSLPANAHHMRGERMADHPISALQRALQRASY